MTDGVGRMNVVPDHAISLWFDGDFLRVLLPPSNHIISIPIEKAGIVTGENAVNWVLEHYKGNLEPKNEHFTPTSSPIQSQRGWYALMQILRERFRQRKPPGIGHSSSPIQHSLELLLKGKPITRIEKLKKPAKQDLSLEDIGL